MKEYRDTTAEEPSMPGARQPDRRVDPPPQEDVACAPIVNTIGSLVMALIHQGEDLFGFGDPAQALAVFQSALDIDPVNARANSNIGVICWQAGQYDRAIRHWMAAFKAGPGDRTVVLNLAGALDLAGQHAGARHVFEAYLKLDPHDSEIASLLAVNLALNAESGGQATVPDTDVAHHDRPVLSTLTPENFAEFTYSRQHHFASLVMPFFHKDKKKENCDLKVIQDMVIFNFLLSNFTRGARVLEIGGGRSRIVAAMKSYFECWNLDKFEGNGSGPTTPQRIPGTRMVRDYMGNFNAQLPENYFDCVYSISTLEHVPEDADVFANITADIRRVLRPGGYSVHCFDIVIRKDTIWSNGLLPHFFRNEKTINPWVPFAGMLADPDIYVLSASHYTAAWQAITGRTYEEFGLPLSYNVLWKK